MTTCLTSLGEGITLGMRMLAMALANPPATPSPGMYYAQQSYTPHFGNYGNITTSLPMTHDASYANREAFPASQFHRLGSGQESGHSSLLYTRAYCSSQSNLV